MTHKCRVCGLKINKGQLWLVQLCSGGAKAYRWKTEQQWEVHQECAQEVVLYVP
jgi:predicted  nucleic acid-binding Zn-ribbon protein